MKIYRKILILMLLLLVFQACKEDVNKPADKSPLPAQISDLVVENIPGGAKITYVLPNDVNLYYVKAEYVIGSGIKREAKASAYSNSITIDGFSDTEEHEVRLYAVNKSEQQSEPLTVKVKPLTAPVHAVFSTLSLAPDFGGVTAKFENPDKASIAVGIVVKAASGEWVPIETFYTSQESGVFSVRGFDDTKRTFGVFIRDRWLNNSDTLKQELIPVFEKELNKSLFKAVNLPTDYSVPNTAPTVIERLWNGNTTAGSDFLTKPSTIAGVGGIPQWFTFDLGIKSQLSRLVVYTRDNSALYIYNSGTVKTWEIWGSNDPNPDGSWESWTKLLLCESVKPSGLPLGSYSADDLAFVRAGWNFNFPAGTPPVRYIRWKTLANWGGVTHINITEATFFGAN